MIGSAFGSPGHDEQEGKNTVAGIVSGGTNQVGGALTRFQGKEDELKKKAPSKDADPNKDESESNKSEDDQAHGNNKSKNTDPARQ